MSQQSNPTEISCLLRTWKFTIPGETGEEREVPLHIRTDKDGSTYFEAHVLPAGSKAGNADPVKLKNVSLPKLYSEVESQINELAPDMTRMMHSRVMCKSEPFNSEDPLGKIVTRMTWNVCPVDVSESKSEAGDPLFYCDLTGMYGKKGRVLTTDKLALSRSGSGPQTDADPTTIPESSGTLLEDSPEMWRLCEVLRSHMSDTLAALMALSDPDKSKAVSSFALDQFKFTDWSPDRLVEGMLKVWKDEHDENTQVTEVTPD